MQSRYRHRIPVGYPANIQSDTCAAEGTLLDLSPTGCRMRSDIALAQERAPLGVEVSVVRWCKDGQLGIEFLRYRQGDRERVRYFVETMPSYQAPVSAYAESTLSTASV
jgi:hypothetical protein